MKNIVGVGFPIPSTLDDYLHLNSFSSLADADIAIFCPDFRSTSYSVYENFSNRGEYEGKKLYNKESSAEILEHSKHWRTELIHFINSGKTLFIVLCKKDDFFVHTGTKDVSGTGKNQKVINHVTNFSNYNFLPFKEFIINSSTGKNVVPHDPLINDLYNNFKDSFTFEAYITGDSIGNSVFITKDKGRVLGIRKKYKSGNLFLIPYLDLSGEKFNTYDEEKDKTFWSEYGMKMGKVLSQNIYEIDKKINGIEEKSVVPVWVKDTLFELEAVKNTELIIQENIRFIEEKNQENLRLEAVKKEQEVIKDLLYESGKPLERAVSKAFHILGYNAEGFDNGELELDQIILSPEGERYIGECEGKDNKDVDISKFRQLLDGLNADFEREEVNEKAFGLLIGNPQRLTKPSERGLDFTDKCKSAARRENIGLIKTVDLFFVCRYILEKNDDSYKEKCRKAILDGLGGVVKFPETSV